MDEFNSIIYEIENAQTPKSLKYLIKRAKNVKNNTRDAFGKISDGVLRAYRKTIRAIERKLKTL